MDTVVLQQQQSDFTHSRPSSRSLVTPNSMDSRLSPPNALRAAAGICLCLVLVSSAPASHAVLGQLDPPSDLFTSQQVLTLLRFLRFVQAGSLAQNVRKTDLATPAPLNSRTQKRNFGIAGLDNVDMITSVLDRSRLRYRVRPVMSASFNLNRLRALMEKAG